MIQSIQDAEAALLPYVPLVGLLTGKDTTLERIKPLMQLAGNPQERLKIVHIAGTSGKTSTSYFIAALLHKTGKRTGLTVSPHVDSITERVQIDGAPLEDTEFCKELEAFLQIVEKAKQPPSYFELLYAFSLWVFERRGVEYAVIETGMGGLFDATNVAANPDKVCVITDIGFDHMHILGYTLAEITSQKIGIVHPGNVALMYEQSDEVMTVAREYVAKQNASLQVTTESEQKTKCPIDLEVLPIYQRRNWLLAHYTYEYLKNRDKLPNLTSQALQETLQVQVPGRMEVVHVNDKTLVMDGAHNEQKMNTFIHSFQDKFPNIKPAILIALKQGKDTKSVLPLLAPMAARMILTTFNTSQDLPAKSILPSELVKELHDFPDLPVELMPDQHAAYQKLLSSPEQVVIITGSFYLLGQLRTNERIIG